MKLSELKKFWRAVEFVERVNAGEEKVFKFEVQFERLDRDELERRTSEGAGETVAQLLASVVKDWRDLQAEDGEPLPYTAGNLDALLKVTGMAGLIFNVYLLEVGNLRQKN